MKKLFIATLGISMALSIAGLESAEAAKKRTSHKRTDFTAAQREKMMEQARKICRSKYGATSSVYELDYYKWRVVCTTPGY